MSGHDRNRVMHPEHFWVVLLYVLPGREAAFADYERSAAAIMTDYGGAIDLALRCAESGAGTRAPYEVHVVRFPSSEAFEEYRADPRLGRAAAERHQAICRTEIYPGRRVAPPAAACEASV